MIDFFLRNLYVMVAASTKHIASSNPWSWYMTSVVKSISWLPAPQLDQVCLRLSCQLCSAVEGMDPVEVAPATDFSDAFSSRMVEGEL